VYTELEQVSSVAADIGGVICTHINHLTPRVLDIDDLYARMEGRGVEMIGAIQGPPRWAGPDLLLRQTSFRALAEPRVFREADGSITKGTQRVRFGEVESRGIATTIRGREVYDRLTVETERAVKEAAATGPVSAARRTEIAASLWNRQVPATERGLAMHDLAYFTYQVNTDKQRNGDAPSRSLHDLIDQQWVRPEPIVYEDFLPKSAAGIFQSNLTTDGLKDTTQSTSAIDAGWMEGALGGPLYDPDELYNDIRRESLNRVANELGLRGPIETPTPTTQGVK
jgi:uncharacterized glyoxalase superfamily metalloenzyme YdcJ